LRFYESGGRKTAAKIKFFRPLRKVVKTDLENNRLEDVPAKGNTVRLDVSPCEIVTLRLRF